MLRQGCGTIQVSVLKTTALKHRYAKASKSPALIIGDAVMEHGGGQLAS